ncbi:MAG TPA: DUF29 domain-containing protein [Bryobacteraceae bacterium]|nr:DUF29 domain-containing protein [Bryobacteraceae bacterium]
MKVAELYDLDFVRWAEENAELLRARRFGEVDIEHVAEQIENLVKRNLLEIRARLVRLIGHLMKWQFEPERRVPEWERTILIQRQRIGYLLQDSPSLRPALANLAGDAYRDAAKIVSRATGRPLNELPETCPYNTEQLLDEDYLPDGGER